MKKKIAFITDSGFWSHKPEIIKELNKYFELEIYIIYVVGFKNHTKDDIKEYCNKNNITLHIIDTGDIRARSPKRLITDYRNIIKPIKAFNPNIIYIESFGSPYFAIMCRVFFNHKKIIVGIHDYKLHELKKNKSNLSAKIYQSIALKFYSNFHFFSFSQRDEFVKEYPNKNTFVVRLYLVGTSYYKKINNKNNKTVKFLYFGRIYHYKGVDILIKAGNILSKKYKNFKIIIAGSGYDRSELIELIDDKSVFDLKISFIKKESIPELFGIADYFIAPYRSVTQSGPLMMAYNYNNIIPIASDIPGFREYIVDGKTGFLFKSEDPISLAKVMERAITLPINEKDEIKRNLEVFKKNEFNIESVVEKYLEMFRVVQRK